MAALGVMDTYREYVSIGVPEMLWFPRPLSEWWGWVAQQGKATHTIFHILLLPLSFFLLLQLWLTRTSGTLVPVNMARALASGMLLFNNTTQLDTAMNNMSPIPITAASALTLLPWSASTTWTFAVNASVNMPTTLVSTRYSCLPHQVMENGLLLYSKALTFAVFI